MKPMDIRIRDKYRVDRKIGRGGFATVYSGTELATGEEVAIKLQPVRDMPRLEHEADIYSELQGGPGISRMHWYGDECDFYVLILDALGPSLEDLFNFCDRSFSLKTVLLLADQLISRVEYLHSKSYVHRDIKPENFLMGSGKLGNVVHIIDFDLAYAYRIPGTDGHMEYSEKFKFGGTSWFASVNNHKRIAQSRRDDLESLGYTLIYFARGSLPWGNLKATTDDERNERIKELKIATSIEDLCRDLPKEFATYLKYVRHDLAFEDRPNYSYLRKLFCNLFVSKGYSYDNVFDWTIRRFLATHDVNDQPAVLETQSPKNSNSRRRASVDMAASVQPVPSSNQPTGHEVPKRTETRGLRKTKARKKRRQ